MIDFALSRWRYSPHKGDTTAHRHSHGLLWLGDALVVLIALLLLTQLIAMTPPGVTSGAGESGACSPLSTFENSQSHSSGDQ